MGDHAEMLHATPAMYNGAGAAPRGGWWSTAVPATTCSTELAGFTTWSSALAASYDLAAEGAKANKSATTASSDSPGNNSSVTFQEPASGVGTAVVQQPLAGCADWRHPYLSSGAATLHGFLQDGHQQDMSSSTTEQSPMAASSLMNPSSNNLALALQQGHHHQEPDHQQMLSNFGGSEAELLLSPTTSPYGFQSSLLRSLMEPTADAAKPALPGYQQQYDQYQQMGMGQARSFAPAGGAASREALQFTNDAPSWNPSAAAAGFGVPPAPAPVDQASSSVRSVKPSPAARATATLALKTALEGVGESASSIITKKKANGELAPAFKKSRLQTPSPLPTFKVRKEKVGDRVTALQQLVAPFGKTDTASVLHETIEYIKFLHDQVGVLSAPYLKNNGHQVPYLKRSSPDRSEDDSSHAGERSLKGRGLCLVPISSTFAVASEVPVDFGWSTAFAASFR
ncbi:Transcription factor bHLH112 [Zea mays]|uniref:Transcription factor bHLH112 n=1 Tax=Zea mays TaxID=4577 RepID=A0A3L6G9A8_MAIZE|nr:Transcription factor bHLH112 [Zea mays]